MNDTGRVTDMLIAIKKGGSIAAYYMLKSESLAFTDLRYPSLNFATMGYILLVGGYKMAFVSERQSRVIGTCLPTVMRAGWT